MKRVTHTFEVFYKDDSEVLILGSIPSVKSRELGFYYMHPKNRFWYLLSDLFNEEFPVSIDDKKSFLIKHKIALWDVLASCNIEGSSDSSIKDPIVNDVASILNKTNIHTIFVTGKTAFKLYQKYCYPKTRMEAILLLSPSPANCAISYENLLANYQIIKQKLMSKPVNK